MCKISIVTPVYNAGKYLSRCIDSILTQNFDDWELILVDDGSTDDSWKIISQYSEKDTRIVSIHQNNSGPSVARNVGLRRATGEYIGFVDSDDFIEPDMYRQLYNQALQNNVEIVLCDYYIVQGNNKIHVSLPLASEGLIWGAQKEKMMSHCQESKILWFAVKGIYKREMLVSNSILYQEQNVIEDPLFSFECFACSTHIYYLKTPLYNYVQTPNSLSRLPYKENYIQKLENSYNVKISLYEKYGFSNYESDLYSYTMTHTIPLLVQNELSSPYPLLKIRESYNSIRNSKMVQDAFLNISYDRIEGNQKYLVALLRYRMTFLLSVITKIYYHVHS